MLPAGGPAAVSCPGMGRVFRRLFTPAAAASAVLCVVPLAAWVESYSVQREVIWNGIRDYDLVSNCGLLRLSRRDRTGWGGGRWRPQPYNTDGVFSGETREYDVEEGAARGGWPPGMRVGVGEDRHPFGDGV